MPGQEQNEDTNGAESGSNDADSTGTNPNYSIKQGSELYGPPSCHESASIPFDDGKGVLVFGGLSYDFTTSNVGDSIYNNDAWYLRVGWENSKQDLKRSGYMWNPAVMQGKPMSPRAGHSGTVITYEDVEMALFFGGFDGVHFFNDLKGIWPIRAQDSVVMTERRNVMSDETIEMGVKAPEMRESSSGSGSGFWKTFVNPYPSM